MSYKQGSKLLLIKTDYINILTALYLVTT